LIGKSYHKLKVGYFVNLPAFEPAACISRAVKRCVEALGERYEVVPFEIPNLREIIELYMKIYMATSKHNLELALQGEEPERFFSLGLFANNHPYLHSLFLYVMKVIGNKRTGALPKAGADTPSSDIIAMYQRVKDLTEALAKSWASQKIDVLITPVAGLIAPRHYQAIDIIAALPYSYIWNVLRFPAGIVPIDLVRAQDVPFHDSYNDDIAGNARRCMADSEGLPVAVQVIGLPFQDELVLRVMKDLETLFSFHRHAL
jgi:fatty acid amide hydrolase